MPVVSSYVQSRTFYWAPNTYIPDSFQYLDHPQVRQIQGKSCPKLGFLFPPLSLSLTLQLLLPIFSITVTDTTSHQSPKPKCVLLSHLPTLVHTTSSLFYPFDVTRLSCSLTEPSVDNWQCFDSRKCESDLLIGLLGISGFPSPLPVPLLSSPKCVF